MSKLVIICVDDEPIVLRSLKAELQEAMGNDYIIEIAESGDEALELIAELLEDKYEIPLIISDHIMPGIKGDELLQRVHLLSPKTIKIMLTGQADLQAVANAIKNAKLYRYISKPWQAEDLSLTVKEAVNSYLQDRELASKNAKLLLLNQELEQLNQEQAKLIDKLHENQIRLKKAEQKYRGIFENAVEGIFQTTTDGVYLSLNLACAKIYGYGSPAEFMAIINGIQKRLYVDANRATEFRELMERNGAVFNFESQVYQRDGSIIWISENARAIGDINSKVLYYQGFVEDITARKKAEVQRINFTTELFQLNQAFSRFVPRQFLQFLDRESIVDVELGDQVQQKISVLFSDIRNFTTLSETMTPQENFKFINSYFSCMESAIISNNGFVDKYIGDGIMALFGGTANDAVNAGIAMLKNLATFNQKRLVKGYLPIKVGIGINTGYLMMGTVGGTERMDTTVIGDDVNLASRLEGLTKNYGVSLLISHKTLACLNEPNEYKIRFIDRLKVKGKSKNVAVFEVFDADEIQMKENKLATFTIFEEGLLLYNQNYLYEALKQFERVLSINPQDKVAQLYVKLCTESN